jgi:hypothetical protein
MALKATKDTYAFEDVGSRETGPILVRRKVMAGQHVPAHWDVAANAVEAVGAPVTGYEAHQIRKAPEQAPAAPAKPPARPKSEK